MKTTKTKFEATLIALALCSLTSMALAQPPSAPFAGGPKITCEQALVEAPKLDKGLAPLDKAFHAADAAFKKKPKDAKLKKAYIEATYKYGHTILTDEALANPKVKYRASLAAFRRVLAVDPKHAPSLADKKTIEDIYATMPGGIPK